MRTCYLHAGMPKTGSTSIQNAFYGYKTDYIRYADFGQANHGAPLISVFSENPENYYAFRSKGLTSEQVAKKVRLYGESMKAAADLDTDVIFSSEGIVDHLKPREIKAMASYLKEKAFRVRVVIYVRPLASLAASQMQQRIKVGLRNFTIPAPDYAKRFRPFVKYFGRENIEFVRFTRDDLYKGDSIKDFALRVGIGEAPKPAKQDNESWSVEALGAMYAFNKFEAPKLVGQERKDAQREMRKKLSNIGNGKFALHESLVEAHISTHMEDIEWAERICGFDVRGEVKQAANPIANESDLLAAAVSDL